MLLAGILLACQDAATAAELRKARGWDDFPVFVWREKYAGKPLPEELAEPFGGVIVMREEDSSWARERGLSYLVWNVAGRDALHLDADEAWNARVEQWIETHDDKLLVREPCLNDPETLGQVFTKLNATIARHGEHPGLGFVLGDEVSLTPNGDPFDLCRCGFCESKWKEYAKEHGLPERAPLTDEVRLAFVDGDESLLGAWLARRRFEREQLSGLLSRLAERIHKRVPPFGDPGRCPVGLLGLRGPAAFGGIDLSSGFEWLDFIEIYPLNDARGLELNLPRAARSLATIFIADESPDSAAWRIWEHWLRGGAGVVMWNDAALAERPRHRERVTRALMDVRTIQQRFPELMPPSCGSIAVVHDADSVALSWLKDALLDGPTWPRRRASFQDRNGARETSAREWVERIEDWGMLPASVPLADIGDVRWEFDALVLPHVCVLGSKDVKRLEWYVQNRGVVVVDGDFGLVDRSGSPLAGSALARLRAGSVAGVVQARPGDSGLSEQLLSRIRGEGPRFMGDAATIPWLIARRDTERKWCSNGELNYLLVLLPRLDRPEHHGRFPDGIELEIEAPKGTTWERIHPPEGDKLPSGDAAVYLVHVGHEKDPAGAK